MVKKFLHHSKKLMISFVILSLLGTSSVLITSAGNKPDTISLKQKLIEKAPKVKITDEKEKDKFAQDISDKYKDVFAKYGTDQKEIDKFFADNGYIKFDVNKAAISGIESLFTTTAEASNASAVTLSAPSIYYNTYTGRWTAVGGGYWNYYLWQYDRNQNLIGQYYNGNMGGSDVFGLHFSSLKTSSGTSVAITKQEFYTRYVGGNTNLTSSNRMNSDPTNGVFFQYQDFTYNDGNGTNYNIDGFSILLEFNSTFANVDGIAQTCMEHTWSKTTGAPNLTLSNSGWNVSFSSGSSSYAWPSSTTDTTY